MKGKLSSNYFFVLHWCQLFYLVLRSILNGKRHESDDFLYLNLLSMYQVKYNQNRITLHLYDHNIIFLNSVSKFLTFNVSEMNHINHIENIFTY
jgi:hypothetical protein